MSEELISQALVLVFGLLQVAIVASISLLIKLYVDVRVAFTKIRSLEQQLGKKE